MKDIAEQVKRGERTVSNTLAMTLKRKYRPGRAANHKSNPSNGFTQSSKIPQSNAL
ncbi:hypothetical protein ZHAS_00021311 [Anopheles sinensis]|uniref:Uncharacterized protein n=1 Tax=Anopheles sinensis TaxID=74873 RepID=A0A084WS22_ANOSI|nr:hypothetical protein ZHAS_00021311 [Anopheles sinensis]